MSALKTAVVAGVLVSFCAPSLVEAQPWRHHKSRVHHVRRLPAPAYSYAYRGSGPYGPNSADPYPLTAADDPYNPYAPPGAALRAMARRNQFAPGVTNELAPDNIATASGGPSGGVPGFSSH